MYNSNSTSLSSTAVPDSVAVRLHEIYRECLEHSSWARIVLETSRERISFSCRKPPTAASSPKQEKNAQQMQNEERGTGGGVRNGWRGGITALWPAPHQQQQQVFQQQPYQSVPQQLMQHQIPLQQQQPHMQE
jgi:hypothetical protein